MSNIALALALLFAFSFYPGTASPADAPKEEELTAVTKSSTGRGIPYGSSTDQQFLPWLKSTEDPDYGYSEDKPVEIGGFLEGRGNDWPAQYFASLLGANGEPTSFERVKSCCAFAVTNPKIVEAGISTGFLDQFRVTVEGKDPVYVYVTLYTAGEIWAPKGFTTREKRPD
jgi:hypothetical protein